MDADEALLALWEAGFRYLDGPQDFVARGDANRARRALGLATRRELGSLAYWQGELELDQTAVLELLLQLGVEHPFDGSQLRKKAIHRLRAEARRLHRDRSRVQEPLSIPRVAVATWPPFVWKAVGHVRSIRHLTRDEVEAIHDALVEDFALTDDPMIPAGVKSQSLLDSALGRPSTAMGSVLKYPTVEMAAASLLHSLIHNHPFHNGNKRTALVSMLVLLDENGIALTCKEDPLFKIVLQLAQHALVDGPRAELPDREVLAVAEWLANNSRLLLQGDRAVPWRRLKRILAFYGCSFEHPSGVGNRINIARAVNAKTGLFGRVRQTILRTQTSYASEGAEVSKNTVHKIRQDLRLDDESGIDSHAFYDDVPMSSSEFIIRYRKTLRRLGRL